ncbi:hypothetical protein PLESTF_001886200 [Pleodorina starrii]|nr:hypothetical protein PLESTF_001886200 [Pleodorina starrii]
MPYTMHSPHANLPDTPAKQQPLFHPRKPRTCASQGVHTASVTVVRHPSHHTQRIIGRVYFTRPKKCMYPHSTEAVAAASKHDYDSGGEESQDGAGPVRWSVDRQASSAALDRPR